MPDLPAHIAGPADQPPFRNDSASLPVPMVRKSCSARPGLRPASIPPARMPSRRFCRYARNAKLPAQHFHKRDVDPCGQVRWAQHHPRLLSSGPPQLTPIAAASRIDMPLWVNTPYTAPNNFPGSAQTVFLRRWEAPHGLLYGSCRHLGRHHGAFVPQCQADDPLHGKPPLSLRLYDSPLLPRLIPAQRKVEPFDIPPPNERCGYSP